MIGKPKSTRGTARAYHHRDLRRALITAALKLVAEKGPTGFSLREAARLVGVTHAAPYRHFASRAELLAAVAVEGFRSMRRAMMRARDQATAAGPLARFEALGLAYVRFAVDHPAHFRAMFASESDQAPGAAVRDERDATYGLLLAEIEACRERGLLRADPAEAQALPAWAIVHGLAMLHVDRVGRVATSKRAAGEQARLVTRLLREGLAANRTVGTTRDAMR